MSTIIVREILSHPKLFTSINPNQDKSAIIIHGKIHEFVLIEELNRQLNLIDTLDTDYESFRTSKKPKNSTP